MTDDQEKKFYAFLNETRYVEFVRSSDTPDEIITIYYDSRANLVARGIIPSARLAEPMPFPAGAGFVPDPRG